MTTLAPERPVSTGPRAGKAPAGAWTGIAAVVLLAGAVVALLLGPRAPIDGFGLIGALPWGYDGALALLLVLFAGSLVSRAVSSRWLYAQVAVLTVMLALAPILLEQYARFPTGYTHAGFVDYIAQHGAVLDGYDARFSWPGFFGAAALFSEATGLSPDALLRWTPLLIDLAYLLAFAAVVSRFVPDRRRRAFALALLVLFNWVGQDYFAPQGVNFLLYLVFVAVLATLYPLDRPAAGPARLLARILRRRPTATDPEPAELSPAVRGALLAALVALFTASTVSHQLTPVFMLLTVGVLTVLRFIRSPWLLVLLGGIFVSWFVWGASDYWQGHLDELLGGVGRLAESLHDNVSSRVDTTTTTTLARTAVVDARMGLAVVLVLLALGGLIRSRSRALVAPAVLAVTPVVVVGLQSYGGEAMLRVELFSLPFLAILASHLLGLPRRRRRVVPVLKAAISAVLFCALAAVFLLARYGNESFEASFPSDVAAVEALYATAPHGAVLFSLTDELPWKDRAVGDYAYASLGESPQDAERIDALLARVATLDRPAYVILTHGQWNELEQLGGIGSGTESSLEESLAESPYLRPVYGDVECGVFEVVRSP